MILITKNTSNTVILTLSEKTTITNVYYLMELINDNSNDKYYFVLPTDTSANKERYNKFIINEGVTFTFEREGFYKYNVYEQVSSTNIDPLLTGSLVDKGKLKVINTEAATPEFKGTQETYKIYGG